LNLFFGKDKTETTDQDELKKFPKLASSDGKFESLSLYIQTWSKQTFTEDGGKKSGLTTPVNLVMLPESKSSSQGENVVAVSGVQLVFKPTKTGNAYTNIRVKKRPKKRERDRKRRNPKRKVASRFSSKSYRMDKSKCEPDDASWTRIP
jgi:hypothetical protein